MNYRAATLSIVATVAFANDAKTSTTDLMKMAENKMWAFYIDRDSMEKSGRYRKVTEIYDAKTTISSANFLPPGTQSLQVVTEYDCDKGLYRPIKATAFAEPKGTGRVLRDEDIRASSPGENWLDAVMSMPGAHVFVFVCRDSPIAKALGESTAAVLPRSSANFVNDYYKHPDPGKISETIVATAESGVPEAAIIPTIMFYSYVFAANPSMRAQWEKQIAAIGGKTQEVLLKAINATPEALLATLPPSAARNDALWSCFFATGSPKCLNELIANLGYIAERSSAEKFGIGASAKWSLASNMQSHPLVLEAIMTAANNASPELRAQAASLLKLSPSEVVEEVKGISRRRRRQAHGDALVTRFGSTWAT